MRVCLSFKLSGEFCIFMARKRLVPRRALNQANSNSGIGYLETNYLCTISFSVNCSHSIIFLWFNVKSDNRVSTKNSSHLTVFPYLEELLQVSNPYEKKNTFLVEQKKNTHTHPNPEIWNKCKEWRQPVSCGKKGHFFLKQVSYNQHEWHWY